MLLDALLHDVEVLLGLAHGGVELLQLGQQLFLSYEVLHAREHADVVRVGLQGLEASGLLLELDDLGLLDAEITELVADVGGSLGMPTVGFAPRDPRQLAPRD